MSFRNSFCFGLALVFACSITIAQEADSAKKDSATCSKCPSQAVATAADGNKSCCSGCAVSAAMKNLPVMTYKVGDESTCCSESAGALAKKHDKPIHFVVAEKSYESKEEAFTALVETTEKFVDDFVTPKKCEASGKTFIAGTGCGCPVEAGNKAELVKKAIDEVKMTYVVGDKKCNCPNEAKTLASGSDEKVTYVVAGKETCCNLQARLELAKAKYAAAVKALAASEKNAESTPQVGASS